MALSPPRRVFFIRNSDGPKPEQIFLSSLTSDSLWDFAADGFPTGCSRPAGVSSPSRYVQVEDKEKPLFEALSSTETPEDQALVTISVLRHHFPGNEAKCGDSAAAKLLLEDSARKKSC